MEKRKLTKADIDKVRNIEGFPIAKDEDIIALSDAPYYTACPNPFIEEFIRENGTPYDEATDDYHREPFAADVSEGKTDPIYMAHSYHTKVPHKAIMRYILHYTEPGDIVFDGFCGTGMTGVAAQMCGNPDRDFKVTLEHEMPEVKWGARKAILSDLSPAATFIAFNYNSPVNAVTFSTEAEHMLKEVENDCGWLYETQHIVDGKVQTGFNKQPIIGKINYTVWSDIFICPTCSNELVFWDVAVDMENGKMRDTFICPHCGSELKKTDCKRSQETVINGKLGQSITLAKQVPVLIDYSVLGKRHKKCPDKKDIELIEKINAKAIPFWYPTTPYPVGIKTNELIRLGVSTVDLTYTRRNLWVLAALWNKAQEFTSSYILRFCMTSILIKTASKLHNIGIKNGNINLAGAMPNALYMPSQFAERNIFELIKGKIADVRKSLWQHESNFVMNCASLCDVENIADNSIDYVFTDPPFGGNLAYSDLSFIWEAWLKVITNQQTEAIMNSIQGKGLPEYHVLMTKCFAEYYRTLKPGRWMTVEFHNSQNAVWNSIQESLQKVGFIIADVRVLNKGQGTYNQMTSTSAVSKDLVISAYKPKESFKRELLKNAGNEETAWAFTRQHLEQLPVAVVKNGHVEILSERQAFLLFDRMVAYHIMNGIAVPIDSGDFYKGLDEKFLKRDGMYFLPDQVNEYDTARIENDVELIQFELFVTNEKSAIAWLYQQLGTTPQTYAEIQPQFMQECKAVDKFEAMPELAVMLDDNFLQDEKGRWYVPDVTKAGDVAKLREKKLLKEFEGYLATKGKLKLFRAEAIRAGFAKLWKDKNYKLIVETANRLPDSVIQEDDKLLMYVDLSAGRV